ncbi:hypothetical protein BDY19DRAFT_476180 [Irpex rosettiformis]|uniref:Uncharacterized protein n=1 Tax=Irpex rosettiformis TaxID=378272 RepID=A0ACB8TRW2_9APHY|nr:hypothetical protein BDY19DRAFT_476180 [Irpex rosettiformis]
MFICRQQLLRAFAPRYTRHYNATRRHLSTLRPALAYSTDARPPRLSSDTPATNNRAQTATTSRLRSQTENALRSPEELSKSSHTASRQTKRGQAEVLPLAAARDPPHITLATPADKVLDRLRNALESRDWRAVSRAMDDVLQSERRHPDRQIALLQRALLILADSTYSHRRAILDTLQTLYSIDPTLELPFTLLVRLTDHFLTMRSEPSVDAPALAMLAPVITDYVLRIHADQRLIRKPYTLSKILWIHFKVLMKLVEARQNKIALASLRQLVQYRVIPHSALENVDLAGRSFAVAFLGIIVRCCVSFDWPNRATFLLNSSPTWDQNAPPAFVKAVALVVESLVQDNVSNGSLKNAAGLIARYHTSISTPFPPDHLQRFYDRAVLDLQDVLALTIYQVLRSPNVLAKHNGPALDGNTYYWLLRRCQAQEDVDCMRILMAQVAEDEVDLPEPALASFIRVAAEHGMFTFTRKLWEKAVASENSIVLREPDILTRLVSLTEARIRNRLHRLHESQRDPNATIRAEPNSQHLTSPGAPITPQENVSEVPSTLSTSIGGLVDHSVGGSDEDDHGAIFYLEQIDEYRAFADSVIETYVEYNYPLRNATRGQLSALARAYVIRGRLEEGMGVLRIVLGRREVPDLNDINIALSAVSAKDAVAGVKVIDRMISLGLKPDSVSFGTVINHAAYQGNTPLILELIGRAREAGISKLDYKTTGKLIRVYLSSPAHINLSSKTRLDKVTKLIDSLLDGGILPSPNMGLDCVDVALRADAPVEAYNFWALLVKTKVQWSDEIQALYRMRIASYLKRFWEKGLVEPNTARRMFLDLGYSSYALQILRANSTTKAAEEVVQESRRTTDSNVPEQ